MAGSKLYLCHHCVGTLGLLFAGTIGTLWFVRSTWKKGEAKGDTRCDANPEA
jgi:hypothetical protein